MSELIRFAPGGEQTAENIEEILEAVRRRRADLEAVPVESLLALFDDFSARLVRDPRTRTLDGIAFLSAWLRQRNLRNLLQLNLNGNPRYLDGFHRHGRGYLAAKPHGLVAMWMAGNVPTLPIFSLVPALLAKNVCAAKLAFPDREGMGRLLSVLADCQGPELRGADLLEAVAVLWFDYRRRELNEALSRAADAKVIWGGRAAIEALTALPRREHCVEIIFGPKYSIGLIGRAQLDEPESLEDVVASLVRDTAQFDQQACSSPQTIFVERNGRHTLRDVGEIFARHFARLPAKPGLDPYTTLQIMNTRAEWAMDASKDVLASGAGADWTVCLDREPGLKEAVGSRTIFLTEIGSWHEVIPLLTPKVQTVGAALGDDAEALRFAEAATRAGVARCVRPGTMNHYDSPWDGKLFLGQLVRWVSCKP